MLHSKLRPLCSLARRCSLGFIIVAVLVLLIISLLTSSFLHIIDRQSSRTDFPGAAAAATNKLLLAHLRNRTASAVSSNTTRKGTDGQIAILVITANRPKAVRNHLEQIISLRPSSEVFPIVISQDGDSAQVTQVIKEFVNSYESIHFIQHKDREAVDYADKWSKNYAFIAQHYKWALDKMFVEMAYPMVVVTEEDLDIAKDFYSYFNATRELLHSDPSIWCISAWNDNGAISDQENSARLYRTDFFPGLGWMLKRELWVKELSATWPRIYWDDWMRQPDVRKSRACIRPEVSRTRHNMVLAGKGSSNALYKSYLASIQLSKRLIDFSRINMSYLEKSTYDAQEAELLQEAEEIPLDELLSAEGDTILQPNVSYRVVYGNPRDYRKLATKFKLMSDIRSGMPRTAYYGVIIFSTKKKSTIYAVHPNLQRLGNEFGTWPSTSVYNTSWDLMSKYLDFAETYCRKSKWTGNCNPKDPGMIKWFEKRHQLKRLQSWGEMIVF